MIHADFYGLQIFDPTRNCAAWEDAAKTCACPVSRERHNLIRQFKLVGLA
jgi:hypothetical protein